MSRELFDRLSGNVQSLAAFMQHSPLHDCEDLVFERCVQQSLFLSVLTLGEIRKGIERLDDPKRRQILVDWLHVELPTFFLGRLLNVDGQVADRWGRLQGMQAAPSPPLMACWPPLPCSMI